MKATAYAAIRKDKDSGHEWLSLTSVGATYRIAVEKATISNQEVPGWAEASPITRIVSVTIEERAPESRQPRYCVNMSRHIPDYGTLRQADGAPEIVDVHCSQCGCSGRVRIPEEEIQWDEQETARPD